MAVKKKEMHLLRPSKLREVQESKHKGEVNSREQNIEKSANISSFRKIVLSVADFRSFLLQEVTWTRLGTSYTYSDVLLTVHLSIFNLVINQLDAQNLFNNKFISCFYMFRAPCAHRQEVKIVLCSLWYHHTYRWPSRARDT